MSDKDDLEAWLATAEGPSRAFNINSVVFARLLRRCMAAEARERITLGDAHEAARQRDALAAEVARLREALVGLVENIAAHRYGECPGLVAADCLDAIYEAEGIARAALKETPDE